MEWYRQISILLTMTLQKKEIHYAGEKGDHYAGEKGDNCWMTFLGGREGTELVENAQFLQSDRRKQWSGRPAVVEQSYRRRLRKSEGGIGRLGSIWNGHRGERRNHMQDEAVEGELRGMLIQKISFFLFCHRCNCVVLGDVYHALKIFLSWLCWVFVLCELFPLVAMEGAGGSSFLRFTGFSLQWLLLLQSTGPRCVGFSTCNSRAQQLRLLGSERGLNSCGPWEFSCPQGMWNLPGPGIEPVSPALAGGSPIHCTTREVYYFL